MTVRRTGWRGWDAVALSDDSVEVILLPDRGAKLVSLRSIATGREWLWQDPARPVRPAGFGDDYAAHDISGFDECFPTIAACRYPGGGPELVDHGELWSRPWACEVGADDVTTRIGGVALPYEFRRTLSLPEPGTVHLDYTVRNHGSAGFAWLWSAHPLLAAEPGMRIDLPGQPELTKEFGLSNRIGADDETGRKGHLDAYVWPFVRGADAARNDLRRLDFPHPPVTDKVIARGLAEGRVALHASGDSERLTFRFDPLALPYVGVCVNMGAWPDPHTPGRWVALEPATGGTDRLDEAFERGECGWLDRGGVATWRLDISV
jgi:hypothetical protein